MEDRALDGLDTNIAALLKAFTSFFTNIKQSERNIVQVNGNNNTVQIPVDRAESYGHGLEDDIPD